MDTADFFTLVRKLKPGQAFDIVLPDRGAGVMVYIWFMAQQGMVTMSEWDALTVQENIRHLGWVSAQRKFTFIVTDEWRPEWFIRTVAPFVEHFCVVELA